MSSDWSIVCIHTYCITVAWFLHFDRTCVICYWDFYFFFGAEPIPTVFFFPRQSHKAQLQLNQILGFRFRIVGNLKAASKLSAVPPQKKKKLSAVAVELHRVSWCFAATAHTHSCDTAQRELQLLSWSYNKATDFSPAHSSWVIWCLVVTSTEPCRQYSSPPRLTCKLLQSWSGVLKSFYPPTRQLKVTTWIFCTFEVDRSWAKCKPNKLCKSLLNDGSYSSNQIIQQSWQPNSFMFEAWTWQVDRWCQLK